MMGELARKQTAAIQFPEQRRGWSSGVINPAVAKRALEVTDNPKLVRALDDYLTRAVDTSTFPAGQDAEWIQDMFFETVAQSSRAIGLATTVGSMGGQADLARLNANRERLRASTENTPLPETDGLQFGGRKLNTTELHWYERVTLNFLEQSIGGSTVEQVLGSVMMGNFADQLARLAIEGDVLSADPFFGILDGWLADGIAEGSVDIPAADATWTNVTTFGEFLDKLWDQSTSDLRYMDDLTFLCHSDSLKRLEIESRDGTNGETMVATSIAGPGLINRGFNGEQVFGQARSTGDAAMEWRVMMTARRNLVMSVGRDMRVDVKFEPRQRAFDYIITSRVAFGLRDEKAAIMGVPPAGVQGPGTVA